MTWQPCNLSMISLTFLLIQQYHYNDNDDNNDDDGGGDDDDTLTMIVLHKWRHFCEWRHAVSCWIPGSILTRTNHPLCSSIALDDNDDNNNGDGGGDDDDTKSFGRRVGR